MGYDISDYIDDYVFKQVGHTDWVLTTGLSMEDIDKLAQEEKEDKGYFEDNIFIYYEEREEEEKEKWKMNGLKNT